MGWEFARVVCAFLAAVSFAPLPAAGANGQNGGRHGVEGVRFWHYGVEDGLSQSTARVLVQDRQGFVWIGTQDGLNRFDGEEFRVYRSDPPDRHSLPDNYITALAPAPDGSVFVGTQAGGLARYRPMLDDFVRLESGEPDAGRQQVRGPGEHGEPPVPEAGQLGCQLPGARPVLHEHGVRAQEVLGHARHASARLGVARHLLGEAGRDLPVGGPASDDDDGSRLLRA